MLRAAYPPTRLFTTEDGLVRNWIRQIRRDSRGYLWFCTVEGLSIFDGSRFRNFTTHDGLPSRLVNDVLETAGGEYWIATEAGVSRFHPAASNGNGYFENFRIDAADDSNDVTVLFQDSAKDIWAGTGGGLYRLFRANSGIRSEAVALGPGRRAHIAAIAEDAGHRLWAGGDGIYVRQPDRRWEKLPGSDLPGSVRTILADGKGRVWTAGYGLTAWNPDFSVAARYSNLEGAPLGVFALLRDGSDGIWIAARGLIHFRPDAAPAERFQVFRTSPVLHGEFIGALARDANQNLWVAVSNLGAARVSREPSELYSEGDGLASRSVQGLVESRNRLLYAITGDGHVLNEYTGRRFEPRPARLPAGLTYMGWGQGPVALHDRTGQWWIATGSGVLRYPACDDARALAHATPRLYTMRDGLPNPIVLRLFEDSRGGIWAGTADGAGRWERARDRWTAFGAAQPTGGEMRDAVHAIAEDGTGAVWLGFASPRVLRIRGSSADPVPLRLAGFVNALLLDHAGRLWIGTSQAGVARIDNPGARSPLMQSYTVDQGLASNHVFSLVEDQWGRIYIAGGRGVDRLSPGNGEVRHFTEENGLPSGETERLYRDRNGLIWFASNFGVARYQPEPEVSRAPPQPLLRDLIIGGVPHPLSVLGDARVEGLELAPSQSSLAIEYRALHFAAGERLRYQYRLLGAPGDWSPPAETETVHYANLAPGRYSFEVRSVNEAGELSAPARLQFCRLSPVWQRWWFLTLAFSLAASILFGLHQYRLRHALMLERIRTRLATDLHDDLGAGLAEIAILSEVAKRKPRESATETLDYVARQARRLRAALDDILWTVDSRRDRLSELVNRMRETALPVLQSDDRNVRFTAPSEEELERIGVAPDLRRHLLLFFKEAAANVARHAGARNVEIEIQLRAGRLSVLVKDDGRGFDTSARSAGHGLAGMRYRAAEINGELRLDSAPGEGTEVELRVSV